MKKILETSQTYLREMTQDDLGDLCEILQDADTMYAYGHAFSDAEAQAWLDKQLQRYERYGFGLWAVIDKASNAFVGQVGLTMQDVEGKEELEIGYLLKRKFWHQGYASEAAIACRDYAFNVLGSDRVVSIIRDTNIASQRVALSVGMHQESSFFKYTSEGAIPHFVYSLEKGKE